MVCARSGRHFQGLGQAVRTLRLPRLLGKRLQRLDDMQFLAELPAGLEIGGVVKDLDTNVDREFEDEVLVEDDLSEIRHGSDSIRIEQLDVEGLGLWCPVPAVVRGSSPEVLEEVRHESDKVENFHNVASFASEEIDVTMVHVDNEMNNFDGMLTLQLEEVRHVSDVVWDDLIDEGEDDLGPWGPPPDVDDEDGDVDGDENGGAYGDEFGSESEYVEDDDMQRLAEDITVATSGGDVLYQFHIKAYLERLKDIRFALVAHHDRGMIDMSTYNAEMQKYHEVLEWLWNYERG